MTISRKHHHPLRRPFYHLHQFIPHPGTFSPDSTSYTPNSPAYCPAFQLLHCHLDNVLRYYPPAQYAPFAKREDLLWRSLWDFLRDDLSFQRFFMRRLGHKLDQVFIGKTDGRTKPSEGAVFDAQMTEVLLHQWFDRLRPVISPGRHITCEWMDENQSVLCPKAFRTHSSPVQRHGSTG